MMRFTYFKLSMALATALTVAACGGISLPKIESDKIDYKSAKQLPPLEVPPDLVRPATDDRYAIPGAETNDTSTTTAPAVAAQATLVKGEDGGNLLSVSDGFERAWRRVGLALDRGGFSVEDRDRGKGVYRVRYVDAPAQPKQEGFFSKWLGFGKQPPPEPKRYQILVKEQDGGSTVSVLDADGNPEKSETAGRIAGLLYEQLK